MDSRRQGPLTELLQAACYKQIFSAHLQPNLLLFTYFQLHNFNTYSQLHIIYMDTYCICSRFSPFHRFSCSKTCDLSFIFQNLCFMIYILPPLPQIKGSQVLQFWNLCPFEMPVCCFYLSNYYPGVKLLACTFLPLELWRCYITVLRSFVLRKILPQFSLIFSLQMIFLIDINQFYGKEVERQQ